MRYIILLSLFLVTSLVAFAQVNIDAGDINSCNEVIYDTGGVGGAGYGNNEDITITICPNDPTKTIKLQFQDFTLDNTNTAPNGQPSNTDFMAVFDGNTIGATSLGVYYQNQLNGVLVGTSTSNTSGCITLRFKSNDAGTGSFTILATCETPCKPPFAAALSIPDTMARICKGDVVTFDAGTSFAQPGFNLVDYYWDYDDGSDLDSLSGVNTTHTFNDEGAYRVKLKVRDDNPDVRCMNNNAVEMVVLVAPDPVFNPMTIGGPVCLGESITIVASPQLYAQDWSGVPYGNLGGAQYVPDQVGSCFTSDLNFGIFSPGQQLTSISQLLGISINFEHSWMGDLQVSIICPTGQRVMMHNQGGSGTNLGLPITNGPGPGTGFDYTWSPTATNGTWANNAGGNATLPAGTYQSVNSLNGLIGCDLNGTWQIEVCDLLGIDDGYIFSWGVDFEPSLLPSLTYFKPEVGLQADSSYWAPAANAVMSGDGNSLTVTPTTSGSHSYTYSITDNHGCTNDTTVSVSITANPVTSAGPDSDICANVPFQLGASISPNPGAVVYKWSPTTGLSNANIRNPTATVTTDITYTVQGYRTGHPLCYTEDQVTLSITTPPSAGDDVSVDYCQNDPIVNINTLLSVNASPTGIWLNGNGTTPTMNFDPATQSTDTLLYITGNPTLGCTDTARIAIQVALPFVLNQSNDTTICENGSAVIGVNPTGGFGAPFVETWDQGLVGSSAHTVSPLADECYAVFVTDVNGCVSPTKTICVNLNPPLQLTNSGNTTICVATNTVLDALVATGGSGGPYNYEWKEGTTTIATTRQVTVSPTQLTQYCLTLTDNCESTPVKECLEVSLYEQPEATFSANKVDGCFPIQVTFTNETTPHLVSSVLWNFGNGMSSDALGNVTTVYGAPICYDVKLTVTSADGCIDDKIMTSYICPFDYPVAAFSMDPNPTTFFDTNIDFDNLSSTDATVFNWNFGADANPPISSLEELTVRYPTEKTGTYPVTLVVANENGCKDSVTQELVITSVFTLYVPNAFSPNKDGVNETFSAKGESVSEEGFSLRIFDRNGGIVFESTDINEVWNGNSVNGKELPIGVYVWKIQAKDSYTKETKESFGHVSLIR